MNGRRKGGSSPPLGGEEPMMGPQTRTLTIPDKHHTDKRPDEEIGRIYMRFVMSVCLIRNNKNMCETREALRL